MPTYYRPMNTADDWAQMLADPVKHWRRGFSARALAYCWHEAKGFPPEVDKVLQAFEPLRGIELLLGLPEHQVPLPGGARPSQSDIWCLARHGESLVSMTIEGKVEETLGPTLGEWLADGSPGKDARLRFLMEQLSITEMPGTSIRYQLLHRTASAVIEARRFRATRAVMLVHSFSPTHQWFDDYAAFARVLGIEAERDRVYSAGTRGGVGLSIGWVAGDPRYLDS